MPLNKVKPNSNMYDWLDATWNTVKGKCPHDCAYCYMKKWGKQPALRFDEKELKTDLGKNNFIFVGSSCDMFADEIPFKWIADTLEYCRKFDNKYLFQTKNPAKIVLLRSGLPKNTIIGTTIETNTYYSEMGKTPFPEERASGMYMANFFGYRTFVTIEPIIDFTLDALTAMIKLCKPSFVNIGANTNSKVKLPEPSPKKITALIEELKHFTEVKIKSNLKRLMK